MMRLPAFAFRLPKTLGEAAKMLAYDPKSTRLVAGGTDLWPNMKRRHQSAATVVGLSRVKELRGIRPQADGSVVIGAMTTLTEICETAFLRA